MPGLDVTEILLDQDFCELVTVRRRHETISDHGRSVVDSVDIPIYAVVTAGSQPDMQRLADGQEQPNLITVHTTQIRLVGPATGNQPDVVIWRDRNFVVTKTYDYSHFGAGFVAAECSSMDYLDSIT